MLEYQISEIEAAALVMDEDVQLEQERQRLLNHKMIADTLSNAYAMLDAEDFSSLSNVRRLWMICKASKSTIQTTRPYLINWLRPTILWRIWPSAWRICRWIGLWRQTALMQVEARLDLIHSITRKYGGQVKDVLDYLEQISKEYSLLTGGGTSSEDLEKELKSMEGQLVALAKELSQGRHALAQELEAEIQQELADLYMVKSSFPSAFYPI